MYTQNLDLSTSIFPAATLRNLRPHEISIIDTIFGLINLDRAKNPQRTPRAWPSLIYIAKKAGISPCTASRSITRLRRVGVITRFQFRGRRGEWHTNCYRAGWATLAAVKAFSIQIQKYMQHALISGESCLKSLVAHVSRAWEKGNLNRPRQIRHEEASGGLTPLHRLRVSANNITNLFNSYKKRPPMDKIEGVR